LQLRLIELCCLFAGGSTEHPNWTDILWVLDDHVASKKTSSAKSASPNPAEPIRHRPVHRLDVQTSGCLILAKTRRAAQILGEMLKQTAESESAAMARQPRASHQISTAESGHQSAKPGENQPASMTTLQSAPSNADKTSYIHKHYLALVYGCPPQAKGRSVLTTSNVCSTFWRVSSFRSAADTRVGHNLI
jgi:23S rRNA-/tRNA-specific pseudouridylate synthase